MSDKTRDVGAEIRALQDALRDERRKAAREADAELRRANCVGTCILLVLALGAGGVGGALAWWVLP